MATCLLATFREAYYPHFEGHVEKLNAAETEEEALRLAAPDYLSRVIGESIAKVARAAYDIHADQFASLAETTRNHPRMGRLLPTRELEEQFREEILRSLSHCAIAIEQYAALYNEYCDAVRAFESGSFSKGMSWSSIVGRVGAGLLGPLGALVGGLAGGLLSDSWEAKKLKQLRQQVTDALNKVLSTFATSRPQVWCAFFDCAYCTVDVRQSIEMKAR